jgi:hypothetical protein
MKRSRQLGFALAILLLATTSFASQLAILRNGFSIRHEGHTAVGGVTRLYAGSDAISHVDIPTAEIDHFELDTPPTDSERPGRFHTWSLSSCRDCRQ